MPRSYPKRWDEIAEVVKTKAGWKCERCGHEHNVASGHVLTVAHLDPTYGHQRWNLAALCQRCHLKYEHRLRFRQLYMFGHSDWFMPHLQAWMLWRKRRKAHGLTVMLCINDPTDGYCIRRLNALEVFTAANTRLLSVESVCAYSCDEPICRVLDGKEFPGRPRLRLGRREFPIFGHRSWVGNWCWDAVLMSPSDATRLLNHVNSLDKLCWDEGLDTLYQKWGYRDRPILPCDLVLPEEVRGIQLEAQEAVR